MRKSSATHPCKLKTALELGRSDVLQFYAPRHTFVDPEHLTTVPTNTIIFLEKRATMSFLVHAPAF